MNLKLIAAAALLIAPLAHGENQIYINREGASRAFWYETTVLDPNPANGEIDCGYTDNSTWAQPGLYGSVTIRNARLLNDLTCRVDVICNTNQAGSIQIAVWLDYQFLGSYPRSVPCRQTTGGGGWNP